MKVEALADVVTWVPDLPSSGSYQVYAKWTADETRATDARYSIVHSGGTAEVSVNQRAAGGLWQYLGSYTFDPLNTPTVSLAANDNGSVAADAIRFVGGPGGAADIAYVHSDHLGTPQAMTDANAQVLWWRDQTPFGQTVAEGGFSVSPLRFPGQYADAESGLAYNYFRDYDPALGRYIQSDPIGLKGGLNTYGYVGGNPLRYVDPYGLQQAPIPDPNGVVPGGPWTPNDAQRSGNFLGPKPQGGGGRAQCQWVPAEADGGPPGSQGYWKTNQPGQKGWQQRYDQQGNPIDPDEAHPGTQPPLPKLRLPGPWMICPLPVCEEWLRQERERQGCSSECKLES